MSDKDVYGVYRAEVVEEIRGAVAGSASSRKLPGMHDLLAALQAPGCAIHKRGREEKFCGLPWNIPLYQGRDLSLIAINLKLR